MNDREVLLEFDQDEGIVGILQEIQKMTTWKGLGVEATCLILGKTVNSDS